MQPHIPGFPWPWVEESVEEGSEDSQDVEPEQENMNMDKQFRGRSLSQKLKRVLGQSHQSLILFVKTWIEDTDDRGGHWLTDKEGWWIMIEDGLIHRPHPGEFTRYTKLTEGLHCQHISRAPIVARKDLRLAYVIVKLGTHSGLPS